MKLKWKKMNEEFVNIVILSYGTQINVISKRRGEYVWWTEALIKHELDSVLRQEIFYYACVSFNLLMPICRFVAQFFEPSVTKFYAFRLLEFRIRRVEVNQRYVFNRY